MGRVRGKDGRSVFRMRRWVAPHREAITVQRIEAGVAVPRFVEMDAVNALGEPRLRVGGVVTHAVVGAVRHHGIDRALAARSLDQRIGGNDLRDMVRLEPFRRNQPDDAVTIAGRRQEHGNAAGDREALLDRLVAIAIAERDFIVADAGGHDGAVGSRGSIQHGIRTTRAEDARRVTLALPDRPAVA